MDMLVSPNGFLAEVMGHFYLAKMKHKHNSLQVRGHAKACVIFVMWGDFILTRNHNQHAGFFQLLS